MSVITEMEDKAEKQAVEIHCTRFYQVPDKPMFTGLIKISELLKLDQQEQLKVAEFSARTANSPEEGYQRAVESTRAKRFGRWLATGNNITPASILLSIRKEDVKNDNATCTEREANVTDSFGLLDADSVDLRIQPKCSIWIVDGQHRIRGIKELAEADQKKIADVNIAFTLLWDLDAVEEATQFVTINKTQKAVRTDLAERFVAKMYKLRGEASIMADPNSPIFKKAPWLTKAMDVLDTLIDPDRNTVWTDKVLLPNETRAKTMTVTQSAFTNSLETMLRPKLGPLANEDSYKTCDIVDIIDDYWNAIKENCPVPFEPRSEDHTPNDYALQQTVGVSSLHLLLTMLLNDFKGVLARDRETRTRQFTELLAVDGIQNIDHWDRTVEMEDGVKGGKWTMMGTNQKTFKVVSDKLYNEIRKTPAYKDLIEKTKGS